MSDQPIFPPFAPTLPAAIADCVQRYGDRAFLVDDSRAWSYREVDDASRQLALGLLALGVGKATRLAMVMPAGVDFVLGWWAAGRIGALTLPLSTFFAPRELGWALRATDADTLLLTPEFMGRDYAERLEEALPGLADQRAGAIFLASHPYLRRIVVFGNCDRPWATPINAVLALPQKQAGLRGDTGDRLLRAIEQEVTPADLLIGICTSGSTAEPKIVIHAHGTVFRFTYALKRYQGIRPDERNYTGMPFFWVGGFNVNLLPVMYEGATMVFSPTPRPDDVLDALVRHRVTRVSMWKPQVAALRERAQARGLDLSFVRKGLFEPRDAAGNAIPKERRAVTMMGMTESFGAHSVEDFTTVLPPEHGQSWGHGLEGVERRIVDPSTGRELAPGEVGELWIRGFSLMQGYYKRERSEVFDENGWFHTGDLCAIDHAGYIFFHGRSTEMIKTAGANVSPAEVEAALLRQHGVREAIVFGMTDEDRGERVVAVVVPSEGAAPDPRALQRALRAEISAYKVPERLEVLAYDEIPRTDSGKPRKNLLRERLQTGEASRARTNKD